MSDHETPSGSSTAMPPLAIIGASCLFPQSQSLDEFWANIRRGVDCISEVPTSHWRPEDYFDQDPKRPDMTYAQRGGFLAPVPFDPLEYGISPNNLEAIDTSQLLGLVAAKRALEDAGYGAGRTFDRSRVGCILGVTGTLEMVIPLGARLGHPKWRQALHDAGVPDDVATDVIERIGESYVPWQENSFPGLLGNVVAGRIANRLDLHGTNCVVDAACASSLSAMHLAALELASGRSDMVLTGGVDTFNDIFMYMCFSKTPALSPSGDARPFSDRADGTILGEGVGLLVLKRLADAERDGDRVYAVIRGIGTSSDGAGNAVYAPKAEGQVRCLQDAYRVAGVSPETIELVEAHGTGTKVGDATEVSGLTEVYQSSGRTGTWCAVGSIKSQIGHTKAAAGVAGVLKAMLALQHRVLPPTIKVERPAAGLETGKSPFYVNTLPRPWIARQEHPRRAAVSAFGFGGSNFHCVLEEAPHAVPATDFDGDVQIAAFSATDAAGLRTQLQSWSDLSDWAEIRRRCGASRTAFRPDQPQRLLLVLERNKTPAAQVIRTALGQLEKINSPANWATPDGAYFGSGPRAGKLGFLFPGQGSQAVGMLRDLACAFPAMQDVLAEADDAYATWADPKSPRERLSDLIYPPPAFGDEQLAAQEAALRATQVAQPAIGAVSLGVLAILQQFGIKPEVVAGHSYGELTALCASRRFVPQALYRLSMLRGRLMAEAQEVDGGMLAVGASLSQVEDAIQEAAVDLVIANRNSPNQVVLSGRLPEIERASELFQRRNIRGRKLQVSAAFHSPLMVKAKTRFRPVLDEVDFAQPDVPVYANSTAAEYPRDPAAARDLLAGQLAEPVQFVRQIENMYAAGVRIFVEVGPGAVLTGLVGSILSGRDARALAVDATQGRRGGITDLAHALAQLGAAGYDLSLAAWDPASKTYRAPFEETGRPRMRVPLTGANYVKPRTPRPPRAVLSVLPEPKPPAVPDTPPTGIEATAEPKSSLPAAVILPEPLPVNDAPPTSVKPDLSAPPVPAPVSMAVPLQPVVSPVLELLQMMQAETARLHQQFLEGQSAALRTLESLLTGGSVTPSVPEAPAPAPAPPVVEVSPSVREAQFATSRLALAQAPIEPVPVSQAPTASKPVHSPTPLLEQPPTSVSQPTFAHTPSPLGAVLLEVVAAKTGYPAEMLALEMSLDHDLGIDSIKRVEILSALQERVPALPAVKPEQLGSLHTLQDVVALLDQAAPAAVSMPIHPVSGPVSVEVPALPAAASSPLGGQLLEVVAAKTGYPAEMLSLEMSLDHDLGIDSIKRVEILSALQERVPSLPAVQPEQLGSLHTLQDVITLLDRTAPSAVPTPDLTAPAPVPVAVQPATVTPASSGLGPLLLEVVAAKTGYPAEMLSLEMSLDHDLGIDSIKRVEILSALQERVPSLPAVQPEQLGSLHTLQDVISLLDHAAPAPALSVVTESPVPVAPSKAPSGLGPLLLEVVAAKTGYPAEMLSLEMSLDHDLGIDSIKRVEILSALQERVPSLPAVQPEQLGSLHTLQDVIALLDQSGPASVAVRAEAASAQPVTPSPEITPPSSKLGPLLLEVVAAKTGYPAEMLTLEMSLDHDLGIDSIKRVEILSALQERVPSLPAVQPEQLGSLLTLQDVVALLDHGKAAPPTPLPLPSGRRPDLTRLSSIQRCVVRPVRIAELGGRARFDFPVGGEVLVTDDGTELSLRLTEELAARGLKPRLIGWETAIADGSESPAGLLLVAPPQGTTADQLWHAIRLVQAVGPKLRQSAASRPAFLAAVTRLDGKLGFGDSTKLLNPSSGGLAGLVKTIRHEWPELATKTIDVAGGFLQLREAARMIVDELSYRGPSEVGLTPGDAWTLAVDESPLLEAGVALLQPGDLVVVTGGARGVTAAAAVAVAETCRPHLVIFGRSPEPQAEPAWLAPLQTEAEIKQHLFRQAQPGTSPREIQQHCQRLLAEREVRRNLAVLSQQAAGVEYHAVDVRDAVAVRGLLKQIQQQRGPIRGVIHGAGVLADQRIEQKTREQFTDVFQTKVQGLFSVLGAVDARELRALVLFSSFTGRYGRTGQVDYAIANEVLNKFGQQFHREHPHCRVAAFNWGPWDGGMVTPGLKQLFESEGVGLIPQASGAELVAAELATRADGPAEVVVLGRTAEAASRGTVLLGVAGWQAGPTISMAVPRVTPPVRTEHSATVQPVLPVVVAPPPAGYQTAFERELDLHRLPCLTSHVLGGKAVVPVVLVLEWLGHGALHRNPGLEFVGVHDLRIFKGLKVGAGEKVQVRVQAGRTLRDGEHFQVPVQLVSLVEGRSVLHAAATVLLAVKLPPGDAPRLQRPAGTPIAATGLYGSQLFHGPAFQTLTAIDGCSSAGISVRSRTAPPPEQWIRQPQRGAWLADPLVLDAALQALIVWSWQTTGNPCLPSGCGDYRQFRRTFAPEEYRVICQITQQSDHLVRADVEFVAPDGSLAARLQGVECVIDALLKDSFARNMLETPAP